MKSRTVMLQLEVESALPIRVFRKAENYELSVISVDANGVFTIGVKVIQAQANVVRKPK